VALRRERPPLLTSRVRAFSGRVGNGALGFVSIVVISFSLFVGTVKVRQCQLRREQLGVF
jgi:hypothetical protein